MPRVSVVIPTYNRAQLVGEAIQSVLERTFADFELIVVDDGSTDDNREVVQAFDDRRLQYIYQENRGTAGWRRAKDNFSVEKEKRELLNTLRKNGQA